MKADLFGNFKGFLNILDLKIGDLGLARSKRLPVREMSKDIMTLWYRAPEVMLHNLKYDISLDLWTIGVIIYEMLSGEVMFQANSEIGMLNKIFNLKGTPIFKKREPF